VLLLGACATGQGAGADDDQPGAPDAAVGGFVDARPLADGRPLVDAAPAPDAWLPIDAVPPPDATPPATEQSIHACGFQTLYRFEPGPAWFIPIGDFVWPPPLALDTMLDIAMDRDGVLVGVSNSTLYTVDPETAALATVGALTTSGLINGLTFVAAADLGATGPDRLLGTATDGKYYEIDRASGALTLLGSFGLPAGSMSSGDVVSAEGTGTWASVIPAAAATDSLLPLQPATGTAGAPVGTTTGGLWGLAWSGGQLYGFGSLGQIVKLDPATGAITPLYDAGQTGVTQGFYGAASRPDS
jgi:hypothetical protein